MSGTYGTEGGGTNRNWEKAVERRRDEERRALEEKADERRRGEHERRADELRESWRRNHPSTEEEGKLRRRPR